MRHVDLGEDIEKGHTAKCEGQPQSILNRLIVAGYIAHANEHWVEQAAENAHDLGHYECVDRLIA